MLVQLDIRNFALIDHVTLRTEPGLSVISGETGAGKSLLIGAIGAIMGNRVSKDLVQTGQERAQIEAVFINIRDRIPSELWLSLPDTDEDQLILAREIETSGRTVCRINGRLVSLSLLKEVASYLMDIHGQNENQKLFNPVSHAALLDLFGGAAVSAAFSVYQDFWKQRQALRKQLQSFGVSAAERERDLDLLRYQVDEIRHAAPREKEDKKLQKHRDLQANAERITGDLSTALDLLDGEAEGGALGLVARAVSLCESVSQLQPAAQGAAETLATCQDLLHEAMSEIRVVAESVEYNPHLLEKIDARLDVLHKLKRKYGPELEDVIQFAAAAEEKIQLLEDSETMIQSLEAQLVACDEKLKEAAAHLRTTRQQAGVALSEAICRELADLGMPNVRFSVSLIPRAEQADGADEIEFLLSPNKGEPLKALAKIASGGEAARIMLAIKLILAGEDRTPLLVFDEVDAGISGRTSELVARKLLSLSHQAQVFCVTHTAQIAAMADQHMLIEKHDEEERTVTNIHQLDETGRLEEVARLLSGGTATEQATELAIQLRAAKEDIKKI